MKKIRPVDGARSCVTRNAFASFLAFACFVIVSPAFSQQELREVGVSPLASMNVLTKKQLDQLKFPPDRGLADKRYNKLRLGVWMSKEEYRTGEPIYALFVVKNDGPKRGLDMWLIVSAQESTAWNAGGLTIKLVDKPPGHKHSLQLLSHIWSCPRSSPMTSVGEGSYLCFRGDLHGHRLPPGTYSLSWRYGKSRSNQVQFKILTERAKGAKKRDLMGNHEFYGWITLWTRLRELNVDADGLPHRYVEVAGTRPQFFEGMSRSLAMGHDNRWYPDIYALPTSDDKLRVLARFVRTNLRRGETPQRVEIRFEPVNKDRPYALQPGLNLGLIVPPKARAKRVEQKIRTQRFDRAGKLLSIKNVAFEGKVSLTVTLPEDWERRLGFRGPAKCAVVISSEQVVDRTNALVRNVTGFARLSRAPLWKGLDVRDKKERFREQMNRSAEPVRI